MSDRLLLVEAALASLGKRYTRCGDRKAVDRVTRSRRLAEERQKNPAATQAEMAEAVGVSDRHVRHLQEETTVSDKRKARNSANTSARQIYLPQCPQAAAQKLRDKFGDDFANQLKEAL